jgi:alkanesulfonate monooxygenase SsuD/methylene tetrahydromethanopterin reductase-like flavin-dependent oxidoreductase (luciferase family)
MRDVVAVMRKAARGEAIEHEGRVLQIPYHPQGEPPSHPALRPILETDPNIPIMFGGGTELMLTLAAEIADGLMPNGSWSPGMMKVYGPMIEKGLAKRATPTKVEDFPIWAHVDVLVTDDIKGALPQFKEYMARFAGGWGGVGGLASQMVWRGYGDAQKRIQELYEAGRIVEAEAAVPDEYIDECWLIGPMPRILERWRSRWINTGANLIVRTDNWPSAKPSDDAAFEPLIRALQA